MKLDNSTYYTNVTLVMILKSIKIKNFKFFKQIYFNKPQICGILKILIVIVNIHTRFLKFNLHTCMLQ